MKHIMKVEERENFASAVLPMKELPAWARSVSAVEPGRELKERKKGDKRERERDGERHFPYQYSLWKKKCSRETDLK